MFKRSLESVDSHSLENGAFCGHMSDLSVCVCVCQVHFTE